MFWRKKVQKKQYDPGALFILGEVLHDDPRTSDAFEKFLTQEGLSYNPKKIFFIYADPKLAEERRWEMYSEIGIHLSVISNKLVIGDKNLCVFYPEGELRYNPEKARTFSAKHGYTEIGWGKHMKSVDELLAALASPGQDQSTSQIRG